MTETAIEVTPHRVLQCAELSPQQLISQAIDKGANVDALERLMALAERVKAEQAREAFNAALAIFQSTCPVIAKTHSGHGNQYTYAKLEDIAAQIKPHMQTARLHYSFSTEQTGDTLTVHCRVTHADGHSETSHASFPVNSKAGMSEQQKVGSAMTYAKRYALMNALGIVVADEDNDAAMPKPKPAADASQPTVSPRSKRGTEAAPAAVTVADLKALYETWCARSGATGRDAFMAWARPIIGAPDDANLSLTGSWTVEGLNACKEAML
jgi:hypothetical protein